MLACDYVVERIDGDYAHLRRTDELGEELKTVPVIFFHRQL